MRDFDMSYYNVYYYCNILDNLLYLFTSSIDWSSTAAQFKDSFYEDDIPNFPKYSALHTFCDYAIRQLIWEEDQKELDVIGERYNDEYAKSLDQVGRLKYAFSGDYKHEQRLWIDRLLHNYGKNNQSFYSYIHDRNFEYFDDEYDEFVFLNGDYDEAVSNLTRELFYVLFQNRDFLYRFNCYLARSESSIDRCSIPSWVKKAVKYRDKGKCVCCGNDLSGLLDYEDDNSIHFDHIVSLKNGGLNDVTNIQLMCRDCNLKKSSSSYTNIRYKDWYDIDL